MYGPNSSDSLSQQTSITSGKLFVALDNRLVVYACMSYFGFELF